MSSSAKSPDDKNDMVEKLVKTGQFTVKAKEPGSKMKQGGNERTSTADDVSTMASNTNTTAEGVTMSTKTKTEANKDDSSTTQHDADDYNDLGQLVHDIQNGDLDADKISLKDFQNSEAYTGANEQTQACIDLAGKVGNNLADKEIVHCSEDTNYFKNKYSLGGVVAMFLPVPLLLIRLIPAMLPQTQMKALKQTAPRQARKLDRRHLLTILRKKY